MCGSKMERSTRQGRTRYPPRLRPPEYLPVSTTIVFLGCSLLVSAQSPVPIFRANSNLQSIAVQVTDKHGDYVKGLAASDFTLLEDGHPQKIAFFESEDQPMSLAILVDASSTMDFGGKMDRARTFLVPLIRGNSPQDEIFLMPFTDQVGTFQLLTSEERLAPPWIAPRSHRGSALYDALATALCRMRNASNVRQAIIVISDGLDQYSRLQLEQVSELVRSSSPQVYMIGLYNSQELQFFGQHGKTVTILGSRDIDNPRIVFNRLAKESGAESFFPSTQGDLKKVLERIFALLKAQYTLAYYPQRIDRVRKIEVKVERDRVKVSTRHSVEAESEAGTVHFEVTSCEVSAKEHPFPWESRLTSTSSLPMVYHEDFSDRASGWPNHHEPEMNAHYREGGGFELSRWLGGGASSASRDGEFVKVADNVIAAYGPWWSNFRASATLEADGGSVGLIFHLMERGYYAFLLGFANGSAGDESFELIEADWKGTRSILIPWTPLGFLAGRGIATKLSVEYSGGHITLLVDGRQVGSILDGNFRYGLVGFGVFGRGQLIVRDLLVEAVR
jgi:Ca-activated chloride channel homolog